MAAKLGQGAGKYDDLSNWSGWVMEDWQAGLGKREAEDGGFLYAELETRFQGQLCLPLWFDIEATDNPVPAALSNLPDGISTILSVSSTASIRKLAFQVTPSVTATVGEIWALLFNHTGGNAQINIYSNSGGQPGTQLDATTAEDEAQNGLQFDYMRFLTSEALTSGTPYWIVIEANSGTIELPVYNHGVTSSDRKQWNGSTWSNSQYSFFFYTHNASGAFKALEYDAEPHFVNDQLYKWNGSAITHVTLGIASEITDAITFNGKIWFAHDAEDVVDTWNGVTVGVTAFSAKLFAAWNGYLWRAQENDVYYSTDGATWTSAIQIGPDGYEVTGMAGLGDDMYVATEEALYRIGAGDLVFGVMRWNNISRNNGRGMINHQGALFIPTYSDLLRYGGSEIMSVGPMKDEGLPAQKQGRVIALASHNYWLLALVTTDNQTEDYSWPMLLAYNDQGWHFVGKLLQKELDSFARAQSSIHWDITNDLLWVCGDFCLYRYRLPVDHQNPYKDNSGNVRFFPGGMIETPWFYSGLKEIYKDCESVYISGENISSARPVKVYWKDDDSTAWELLGTVTSNRQELRWSDYTTRPNTRQIKLALVMYTDDYTESPRVDAVRLKYMNMVTDRWRWTLSIPVSDEQEMLDGDINIYTKEQQRTHLETLARSVPPVIFEDVDGVQYEVKVLGASEQVEKYEYFDEAPNFTSVYSFTIEQATTTAYN